ncbi:MAG: NAD(P)/FAD-dependent oxidoreductase [Syntrophomonadaceae bacterium]
MTRTIVIIGNGAAGNSAAETIRKNTRHGKVIMIAHEDCCAYSACALPDFLSGRLGRNEVFLKTPDDYSANAITTLFGRRVTSINSQNHTVCLGDEDIKYDELILATGSRAFLPPVPGAHLQGNFTVKSIFDVDAILEHHPQEVVVVGSGNIGVEISEALHMKGCKVTLVEQMNRILPRVLDEVPAQMVEKILRRNGINIFTEETVLQVAGNGRVKSLSTNQRTITCDTVVWATGVKANVQIADWAGVEIGSLGGIKVDSHMKTNLDHIYACGDCTESINMITGQPVLSQLWPTARQQGKLAALHLLGYPVKYEGSLNFVTEEIFGTNVVSIGLTSHDLKNQVQVIENHKHHAYARTLIANGYVVGFQSIGLSSGWGAMTALIKSRTPLSELHRILADPFLYRKMSWYLPAREFF